MTYYTNSGNAALAKAIAAMAIIPNNDLWPLAVRAQRAGDDPVQLTELEKLRTVMISLFRATSGSSEARDVARAWWRDYQSRDDDIYQFNLEEMWNSWLIDPPLQVNLNALYDIADTVRPGWQREWHREYVGWRQGPVEPVDLWAKFDPPALPRGLLPRVIEEFALEQGKIMGADPSGFAVGGLVVCAAAISDKIRLQVKSSDSWTEAARIWAALIGDPSSKKTPIIYRVVRPAATIDSEMWREYLAAKEHHDSLSAEERRAAPKPRQRRLRIEDTTIEAAQEVLASSPDGVLCTQDELSGWFAAMDKYSGHRGAMKDRAFWLQAYNGGNYAYNRITRGSGMIENLSVSMLGGIQPEPMRKLAADTIDDGLIQRLIMVVLQPATIGSDDDGSQDAGREYDELIKRLHDLDLPFDHYRFDDGAKAIRKQLEQKHLDLIACKAIHRKLAAHIGKYDGLFARLCLIWQCIENPQSVLVSEATAAKVRDFVHRFLLPHAVAFYAGVLGLSDDHDRLTAVAGYILARRLDRITNRDVQRGDRTMRGLNKNDVEGIFHQLEALGWIRREPGARVTDPAQLVVNPEVHARFAARASQETMRREREREMIASLFRQTP
jgi:hypothetical protein